MVSRNKTELRWLNHLGQSSPSISQITQIGELWFFVNVHLSFSAFLSPSALPSSAMDLCWTSTSASAGEDSTIQAEWRSMALKVGYKSLCDIIIHIAASCQIKTLNLSKASFWDLWKNKKQLLFSVDSHTFCLKFLLCLWMGILGLLRLWKLNLQSKGFFTLLWKCLLCFYSELLWEPQVAPESRTCWIQGGCVDRTHLGGINLNKGSVTL